MSGEGQAMKYFFVRLIIVSAAAFGIAPLAHAEVRIGLSVPRTGTYGWIGTYAEEGARIALVDLNAKGGALGEPIGMITVDDYCATDQAVAAARKLVEAGVVAVFGHPCSGAAIPASRIYAKADILMISSLATNPKLTEQGFRNIFRMVGRDDIQGKVAGDLLASRWGDKKIAILHDGEAYGKGLAEETRRRLNQRGVTEAIFEAIEPREVDHSEMVRKLQAMGINVLYYAGYAPDAALLLRSAREELNDLQLVGGDALALEDFGLIAGPASEGTLFTNYPDPRRRPEAAAVAARLTSPGARMGSLMTYAALQVWVQAVDKANTLKTTAVAEVLHSQEFETILGRIGFDAKGDVAGNETFVWYQWQGGDIRPVDPGKLAGKLAE
jgi:branched-chain amino acid transport system substrate-binding protein